MAGIGEAASIIAVIQISARIGKLCGGYLSEVRDAKKDIERLQSKVLAFHDVLQNVQQTFGGSNPARLPALSSVLKDVERCVNDLEKLQTELDPGRRQKAMKRIGLRALKWPFTRKKLDETVKMLDSYMATFSVAFLADQTSDRSTRLDSETS
jgi:hypothetical protein